DGERLGDNDSGQQEVGRLVKVRYLVLGSVTQLGGLAVNARLVDVRSGLIVQTARVAAGTPDELLGLLPGLARLLLMSDEQKMAYEQELAAKATVEAVPVADAPLPPPPPMPAAQETPPPPIIVHADRPPELGG